MLIGTIEQVCSDHDDSSTVVSQLSLGPLKFEQTSALVARKLEVDTVCATSAAIADFTTGGVNPLMSMYC